MRPPAAVLGLCLALSACTAEAPPPGIAWAGGLEAAQAQSKRDGRPVILYFTFDT